LSIKRFDVVFKGKASHASGSPHLGINALDAVNLTFAGVNAWRQQLPTTSRVHGIITNGGTAPNAIPDYTSGFFYIRSSSNEYQRHMESRLDDIARGSALIAGCDYKLELRDTAYSAGTSNEVLAEEAERIMTENNIEYQKDIPQPLSTDFANVCDKLPGVNIYFDVTGGKQLSLHSHEFREVAASAEALPGVIRAAKVMTRLALNYLQDEVLRTHVKQSR
jgi:metal-dependent amidase/aminoacylase/carboxypeptidase family protein